MSKSYNIKGKRFLRLYTAKAKTASYAAVADAYTISTNLCDVEWTGVDEDLACFPFHAGKAATDESNVNGRRMFDAAMFCAEHDSENGMHRAYAQAACYRFVMPETGMTLERIIASVSSDPYTVDGARIAVFTSDEPAIPMQCVVCRTGDPSGATCTTEVSDSDGDGIPDTWTSNGKYADHVAPRRVVTEQSGAQNWYVGTGRAVLAPQGGLTLRKYLFLFVLLENYNTSRSGYLEGSSYIAPKVELTLNKSVDSWDAIISGGKTEIECGDDPSGIDFKILSGGVPPVVDPATCRPIHFRDLVSETPFSDDCLPVPDVLSQYTPPGEYSLTVMEEGGEHIANGTYPWKASSLFIDDPAGLGVESFSGGVKQEVGPRQLVYKLRDLFAMTYRLSRFPFFNRTAYDIIMARRNLTDPDQPLFPYLVQPRGGLGDHGDFMYGDEIADYYLPPAMGDTAMPTSIWGSTWATEGPPVSLYSPFNEYTHKGALALGGRLSSIHCLYNKGDTDSPLHSIAPGVRILVASFSEGSVTHGDNSEYFEFVSDPLVYGEDLIKATDAYDMLSGETATKVFIGDPFGPDSSLATANHDSFFRTVVGPALASNVPNTRAVMLKTLIDGADTYEGIAYDIDRNGGLPFEADFAVRYSPSWPNEEIYDGGYLPDSTIAVHMLGYSTTGSVVGFDDFVARNHFDSGRAEVRGTTYSVTQEIVNALHDPEVYQLFFTVSGGSSLSLHHVRRYHDTGWQYRLWQYTRLGQLVARFGSRLQQHSMSPPGVASPYLANCQPGDALKASVVYPIFVTDGTSTKILAFLRLVTRDALDIVAYPKSSDENRDAYSLSTVSWDMNHNVTPCFFKWFTATYAQIWAPGDDVKDVDFGGCDFLRYPNMLNGKATAVRYTYDETAGTITPTSSVGPLADPVKWSNDDSDGTFSVTYAGETITGHGKAFGVCKVPVKFDSYVYLFGSFTDLGGVPCRNVVKVYFTENGPVAQNLQWDSLITPGDGSEGSSEGSETDPIYFELAPEAVCGTGPEFSKRLVMYGRFTSVGDVQAPSGIAVVDPVDLTITPLTDPMRIGFTDKSYLMNADSTSGICAYLNNNGNLATVRDVTVYPEEIPWSRTVKPDSGVLGVRNCYAKFYEGNVTTSPAYLTYAVGPVFLIGHVKKFARKWATTSSGQEIVPGHVPVWRILCAPMGIPYSLPAGTKCSALEVDWTGIVMSGDLNVTDADSGATPTEEPSSDSDSDVPGYEYPVGYDTTSSNVASMSRYAECTKGTLFRIWVNDKTRFVSIPDDVAKDHGFYDGSKTQIGDWRLVGTVDPYSGNRKVRLDLPELSGTVGTIAITAWVPTDVVDIAALGKGYIGSGFASETSMLHNVPTVGYGWVPDITFLR